MSSADNADASQAQLQLLLAELKRIEGQQQQLKKAAAENQVLIVHPVEGFKADDVDEYAEPEEVKPDPDRFVPSGGMTGFDVAKDLLKIDFSPPKEAPEEFRALSFVAPPKKQGYTRPALLASQIYHQGSFGAMDPASNDLYMFLEKLQQQQKEVVALIKERQRIIAAKNRDSPSPVMADAAVTGVSPSLKSVTDAIPAKPSRFALPSEGDAVLLKAKTAGLQELNPGLGAQAEVLAMRVQAGEDVQGTAAGMEPVTTTGNNPVTESRAAAVTGGGTGGSGYQFNNTPSTAGTPPGPHKSHKSSKSWSKRLKHKLGF